MVASYHQGSVAHINYTVVPIIRTTDHCLAFSYYMFPGPVGSLAVCVNKYGKKRVWLRQVKNSQFRTHVVVGNFRELIFLITKMQLKFLLTRNDCLLELSN